MATDLSPIVLFCFNRPQHTKRTLLALSENTLAPQSKLFVFCDGAKIKSDSDQQCKIEEVRKIVKSKKWCGEVTIFESEVNKGLANSVIEGVTKMVNMYGKVIVLEDDLITSTYFLEYMNRSLIKYESCKNVFQISAHMFPIQNSKRNHTSFFLPMTTSWGWATWKRAWDRFDSNAIGFEELKTNKGLRNRFDLDGTYPYTRMLNEQMQTKTIDSWAIRWWWSVFCQKGISLFPDQPLVKNIGFDLAATHTDTNPFEESVFDQNYRITEFPDIANVNKKLFDEVKHYLALKNNINGAKKETILKKIFKAIFK